MCHGTPKLELNTCNYRRNKKGLDMCHGAPVSKRNTNICSENNKSLDICHKAATSEGRASNYCEYTGLAECFTKELHSRTGQQDWREELLFHEMSYDLTADVANKMNGCAADDRTDECDTPTDVVHSVGYAMKDVALERAEKVNAKKRSAADALGVCRDKKKVKKCKSNFTANRDVQNIRKTAGSKLEEKTVIDAAANCCAELELTTLCGSSAKEYDFDSSTISVNDFVLPLSMFINTSTPCVKVKRRRKRKYNRKVNNFKRKVDASSSTTNPVALTSDESARDLSMLNLSLPTPRPPRVASVSPKR